MELVKELNNIVETAMTGVWKQTIGSHGLMRLVDLGVLTMKDLFVPPKCITQAPFADSEDLWWQAAGKVFGTPAMWLNKGGAFAPNYEDVMTGWKDQVEKKYGFRPSRTKERSMTQELQDRVKQAMELIGQVVTKNQAKAQGEEMAQPVRDPLVEGWERI